MPEISSLISKSVAAPVISDVSSLGKTRVWHWVAFGLCAWLALFFVAMNWQLQTAIGLVGYTKDIAAFFAAYLFYSAPRRVRTPGILKGVFAGVVLIALLWGVNDTFFWDGIHTAGRAHMFYEGDYAEMRRLSLTYVILGFLLRFVANTNWMGHLYIMGCSVIMLAVMSRAVRQTSLRMLIILMGLAAPHLFVLSKWLYLDIPVTAGIIATIFVFNYAARKPTMARFAAGLLVLLATCTLKEVGALVFIPLVALPLLVPKGRRWRVLIGVVTCILASAVVTKFTCSFYSGLHSDRDEANWLLLNPHFGPLKVTLSWFTYAFLESIRALVWWGFLFIALAGMVRPRGKGGYVFLTGILLCQIVALLSIGNFEMDRSWTYAPLMEPARERLVHYLAGAVVLLLIAGVACRSLAWRWPQRLEWLFWIFVVVVIFFFAAAGKIFTRGNGDFWISTDWRYIEVCVPMLVIMAAKSMGRILGRSHPAWFRGLAAGTLALSLLFCFVRSADMAVFSGEKARIIGRAYQAVQKQPARIVYTHWPLRHGSKPYDYGALQWASDGFTLHPLTELPKLRKKPKKDWPTQPAILIHYEEFYSKIPSRKWFKDSIFDEKRNVRYLQPIGLGSKRCKIKGVYAAKVKF